MNAGPRKQPRTSESTRHPLGAFVPLTSHYEANDFDFEKRFQVPERIGYATRVTPDEPVKPRFCVATGSTRRPDRACHGPAVKTA